MNTPTVSEAGLSVAASEVTAEAVTAVFDTLAAALEDAFTGSEARGLDDEGLLAAMRGVEAVGRRVDALRVLLAGEVTERSPKGLGGQRLSARMGCRTPAELIARVTGVCEATASRRARLGAAVAARDSLTGEVLPARFPAVAEALASGALGEDSARVIVSELGGVEHRADPGDWAAAEAALVADAVAGFTADQTRV
ncbi:hypothetical protein GCM10027568_19040 [Humibacter soli]